MASQSHNHKSSTDLPIDVGNVYATTWEQRVNFVVVDGFWIDEDGNTQVRVRQYVSKPIAAHSSAGHLPDRDARRTVNACTFRRKILEGELEFDGKK